MKEFYAVLQNCPLFAGVQPEELEAMLGCLNARKLETGKEQFVFHEGEPADFVGVVLSGAVRVVRTDFYGNQSILGQVEPGGVFGEAFSCAGAQALPVSVVADEDSTILLLDSRRIGTCCSNACDFHNRVIYNLLRLVATKNLVLHQKIQITSKRTTREKLMAYLLLQAKRHNSNSFEIPYDRQ